jgi:hypothetical protein
LCTWIQKIVQSNSQTSYRICQVGVDAKKDDRYYNLRERTESVNQAGPGCLRDMTYPERLKMLKLPTLVYRRLRGDMIEMYKMVSGAYDEQVMPAVDTKPG